MIYTIIRSDRFHEQLVEIFRHVLDESASYEVAAGFLSRLEEKIRLLATAPHMGSYPRTAQLRKRHYRVLIIDHYLVFYKYSELRQTVRLYQILDSRTNYIRNFF